MTITPTAAKTQLEAQAAVLREVVDEQLRIRSAVLPVVADVNGGRMTDRAGELARLRDTHQSAVDAGYAKAKAAAAAAKDIATEALGSPASASGSVEQRLLAEVAAGRFWDRTRSVLEGLSVWDAASHVAELVRTANPEDRSTLLVEAEPYLRGRIGQARRANETGALPARDGTAMPALSNTDATADVDRLLAEIRAAVTEADPALAKVQTLADEIVSASVSEVAMNVWLLSEWMNGMAAPSAVTSKPGMVGDLNPLPDALAS